MSDRAFTRALEFFDGNHSAFARAVGASQQRISYVAKNGNAVPADLVLPTERATGISRTELRPDLYPPEGERPAAALISGSKGVRMEAGLSLFGNAAVQQVR
ncbi:MAG: transcriptional regulator [Sphingomonas oligoaromativorans]